MIDALAEIERGWAEIEKQVQVTREVAAELDKAHSTIRSLRADASTVLLELRKAHIASSLGSARHEIDVEAVRMLEAMAAGEVGIDVRRLAQTMDIISQTGEMMAQHYRAQRNEARRELSEMREGAPAPLTEEEARAWARLHNETHITIYTPEQAEDADTRLILAAYRRDIPAEVRPRDTNIDSGPCAAFMGAFRTALERRHAVEQSSTAEPWTPPRGRLQTVFGEDSEGRPVPDQAVPIPVDHPSQAASGAEVRPRVTPEQLEKDRHGFFSRQQNGCLDGVDADDARGYVQGTPTLAGSTRRDLLDRAPHGPAEPRYDLLGRTEEQRAAYEREWMSGEMSVTTGREDGEP
ncbi:MAG: hypothetical protein EKK62_04075 [Acidimicrobiia bacterium]|nr:MAG: hypothetical protein EKK62_04075 [Acidimicrobiia bacterium]